MSARARAVIMRVTLSRRRASSRFFFPRSPVVARSKPPAPTMALRRALLSLRPNVGVARAFGTAPTGPITVADRSIDVTVVVDGIRHKLKGKVGKTLAQALAESNDPTLEAVVPEVSLKAGPDTHVTLPPSIVAQLPEMDLADTMLLEDIAENPGPISRMASQVVLTKELDGMNVAVAPNRPFPSGPAI
jgi:hypothetical protein